MTVYQTSVFLDDDKPITYRCDTIIYENEPWLVLSWLPTKAGESRQPERIVRLAAFGYRDVPKSHPHQYEILTPLPKVLIAGGQLPKELERDVIDHPLVSILIGSA